MEPMKTINRKNLFILSFTLLVVMLGYSLAMPLLPFYIERFGVGGTELGWLMSTYSLMQLICAPIWGIASDRYGRKPILAMGVLGYTITLFMFGIAQNFITMFIARSLSGILSSAAMPTAMAYIGDNTPQKEKGKGMGQLGAMAGIGVVLGPLLGGLLSTDSLSLPFFVGSALAALALFLVIFLLPESKPASSSTGDLPLSIQPTSAPRPVRTRDIYLRVLLSPAGILLLLIFIMSFGMTNFLGMIGLYVVDKLDFTTTQVGSLWMVMGAMLIVVQSALVGVLTEKFGDLNLIKVGLMGGALGFVLVAFAWNYMTALLALGFFILALALIGPALNSYISNFAGEHQGTVMGLNGAFTSFGQGARSIVGRVYLRYQHRIPLLQRRGDTFDWAIGQSGWISKTTIGRREKFGRVIWRGAAGIPQTCFVVFLRRYLSNLSCSFVEIFHASQLGLRQKNHIVAL